MLIDGSIVITEYADKKIAILSPVVKGRKGHYQDLFKQILKAFFRSDSSS